MSTIIVTHYALSQVIRRHKLKAKKGFYQITDAMVAEAQAIDAAEGVQLPSPADVKAALGNQPENKWFRIGGD